MQYQNMEFRLSKLRKMNKKLQFILICMSLFLMTGCIRDFYYMLNPSEYDKWREEEINREGEWLEKEREQSNKFDAWAKQEAANLEYLVGSSKEEIRGKFGKPTRIERNRKFSYKGKAFIAKEVWTYRIKERTKLYTNYDIVFAFEGERVIGIIVG